MKFWPTHSKAMAEPVIDLDSITGEPVPFRFNGKIHKLKPISTATFFAYVNAEAAMMVRLKDKEKQLSVDEFCQMYYDVIASVCDTISLKDVRNMEQAKLAALYQLVIDLVTGHANTGDGKKKRKRIDLYEYVGHS